MWSQKSKSSITSDEHVKALTNKLRTYIEQSLRAGRHVIIPSVAAGHLGLSTPETLGLLMVLENEGLLQHKYRLYCKLNDAVVFETTDQRSLPVNPYCKFCDCNHNENELDIEVVIEISAELPVGR